VFPFCGVIHELKVNSRPQHITSVEHASVTGKGFVHTMKACRRNRL